MQLVHTQAPAQQLPEVNRKQRDGTIQKVACPELVSSYNKSMGGVDKNDQMKSYYPIPVAGKKWWSRVFFDLIDRSIYNSFVLEQESPHHGKRSQKLFQIDLAKQLIGNFCSRRKHGRPSDEHLLARHVERHFPDFLPANKGKRKERRCSLLWSRQNQEDKLLLSWLWGWPLRCSLFQAVPSAIDCRKCWENTIKCFCCVFNSVLRLKLIIFMSFNFLVFFGLCDISPRVTKC